MSIVLPIYDGMLQCVFICHLYRRRRWREGESSMRYGKRVLSAFVRVYSINEPTYYTFYEYEMKAHTIHIDQIHFVVHRDGSTCLL